MGVGERVGVGGLGEGEVELDKKTERYPSITGTMPAAITIEEEPRVLNI